MHASCPNYIICLDRFPPRSTDTLAEYAAFSLDDAQREEALSIQRLNIRSPPKEKRTLVRRKIRNKVLTSSKIDSTTFCIAQSKITNCFTEYTIHRAIWNKRQIVSILSHL